jgi:hypothetical protein
MAIHLFKTEYFLMFNLLLAILKGVWLRKDLSGQLKDIAQNKI